MRPHFPAHLAHAFLQHHLLGSTAAVRCDAQRFFEGFWNEAGNAEVRRSGTNAVYGETIDVDAISSFGINSEKSNIYSESI